MRLIGSGIGTAENPMYQRQGLTQTLGIKSGRTCRIRTCDQRIKSPLLYQLS